MTWLGELRTRPVEAVAKALDLPVRDRRFPCPACARAGERGSATFAGGSPGWRCHRCEAGGSPVDLAAIVLLGSVPTSAAEWERLREACVDRRLVDSPETGRPRTGGPTPAAWTPAPPAAPSRPPGARALWEACSPAAGDAEVASWLRSRGLDPELVTRLDLARALPVAGLPDWLPGWARRTYRAVLPMYDAAGELVSLRFRAVRDATPKAVPPKGYEVGRSFLADATARAVIAGELDGWDRRVVVAEGEPDFLTWATVLAHRNPRPAVIGVIAGSWSAELAARIPTGSTVIIRTHHDPAGDGYADAIRSSLIARCRVLRASPGDST